MLRHSKGYRPFVPLAVLVLGLVDALLLVAWVPFLVYDLLILAGPLYYGDGPRPTATAVILGALLLASNVLALLWGLRIRKRLGLYRRDFKIWLVSLMLAATVWIVQPLVISAWFSLYWPN